MKRLLAFFAVIVCISMFTSCGAAPAASNGKPTVVTTIVPQYDFVRAIAGDTVNLSMLVSPGAESHTYDPSIADVKAICDADLFIYTGGEIDEWAADLESAVKGADVKTIRITDAVPGGSSYGDVGNHHDHHRHTGYYDHNDHHDYQSDEHIWTSPENAVAILDYILDALIEIAPENEALFRANADAYRARIDKISDEFAEIADAATGITFVVADRFPFGSLFEEYGFSCTAALDGCAVGVEPSASVVAELIDLVSTEKLAGVFYIEFSDRKVADVISAATGCEQWQLHSCHNVSRDDFDRGVTYCDLMEQNADNMRAAIGARS